MVSRLILPILTFKLVAMATSLERSEKKASVQNPERRKTVVCVCVCMW